MPRRINKKNQKELLLFYLFVCFSVSPSFAQSQGTPTGQQTQQAPIPTTNSKPSSIRIDIYGTLNGSIQTNKFPVFTLALPQGWRAQDVASRQQSAEAAAESPAEMTDKSSSQVSETRASFTYGAEMDFSSGYVWRGLLLDEGLIGQPSAWISRSGFTFIAYSNVALTSKSGTAGLKAGGFILTYDRDWEKLRIEAALDTYLGRQSLDMGADIEARDTMEGSLKLSYPTGPLRIFTTHAFDLLAYRGSYFGEAGLEYEREVTKSTEFATSIRSGWASAKFNYEYIGVNKSAFNLVGAEGSLTYYRGQHLYFRPHIEFSSITDRRLRAQLSPSNIVNFGLAFGWGK
jgi:hypothetical protein